MSSRDSHWRRVGKIQRPRGLGGDWIVSVFSKQLFWAESLDQFALSRGASSPSSGLSPHFQVFQVDRCQSYGSEGRGQLCLRAQGIEDRTASEAWVGAEFWVSEDHFVSSKGEMIVLEEIRGFSVFRRRSLGEEKRKKEDKVYQEYEAGKEDQEGFEEVGQIENFSSNGPQDLLVVRCFSRPDLALASGSDLSLGSALSSEGCLVRVPFVEAFLIKILFDERRVLMDLPEGLLEEQVPGSSRSSRSLRPLSRAPQEIKSP